MKLVRRVYYWNIATNFGLGNRNLSGAGKRLFCEYLKVLGWYLPFLFQTKGKPDLLHRLLAETPLVFHLLLPQYFFNVLQHLLHLDVVHGVQGFQDSQFAHRFHNS